MQRVTELESENIRGRTTERDQGFTLMEILLALLITSILILGVNVTYRQAYLVWSDAENKRLVYHTGRLVTDTLRQELSCLFFPSATGQEEPGGPFRLSYLPKEGTELIFYTLAPSWKGSLESSRMAEVRYRLRKDPETEEKLLERFERLCGGDRIIGGERLDLVVRGLSDFRVWAADPNSSPHGNQWKVSYDSKGAPPKALKVRLEWAGENEISATEFETCFLVTCQGPLKSEEKEPADL